MAKSQRRPEAKSMASHTPDPGQGPPHGGWTRGLLLSPLDVAMGTESDSPSGRRHRLRFRALDSSVFLAKPGQQAKELGEDTSALFSFQSGVAYILPASRKGAFLLNRMGRGKCAGSILSAPIAVAPAARQS